MNAIETPVIPADYLNFAKACAALADSHGVKVFTLKLTPHWRDPKPENTQIHGDIQINFTSIDGRGRPGVNLSVYMTTNTTVAITSTPQSFS